MPTVWTIFRTAAPECCSTRVQDPAAQTCRGQGASHVRHEDLWMASTKRQVSSFWTPCHVSSVAWGGSAAGTAIAQRHTGQSRPVWVWAGCPRNEEQEANRLHGNRPRLGHTTQQEMQQTASASATNGRFGKVSTTIPRSTMPSNDTRSRRRHSQSISTGVGSRTRSNVGRSPGSWGSSWRRHRPRGVRRNRNSRCKQVSPTWEGPGRALWWRRGREWTRTLPKRQATHPQAALQSWPSKQSGVCQGFEDGKGQGSGVEVCEGWVQMLKLWEEWTPKARQTGDAATKLWAL